MGTIGKDLTNVPLATALSTGLHSVAFLLDKIEISTTSNARKTSESNLMTLMEDQGLLTMDPDLAIRAFEVLAKHEIDLIESKRKVLQTQVEVYRTLSSIQNIDNNVSIEGSNPLNEKDPVPNPLEKMENSLFPGV